MTISLSKDQVAAVTSGFQAGVVQTPVEVSGMPGSTQTSNGVGSREKKEIERLRSQHPDYKARIDHWMFLLRAYEGGPQYIDETTIFKHQREHNEDYQDRLKRAEYQNYCQPIVDFAGEFIFAQPVERNADRTIKGEFDTFIKNVDRRGTTIDQFMRLVADETRLFGKFFVQIDVPAMPDTVDTSKPLSKAQADALGISSPYFIPVRPTEVLAWATDDFGGYTYLKRVEHRYDYVNGEFVSFERYYEWTPTECTISTVNVTNPKKPKLQGGKTVLPHQWGQVPFIDLYNRPSKIFCDQGISTIEDIAYQNRKVTNLSSLIEEFLYRQCFNLLAMEMAQQLPIKGSVDNSIGNSNVLEFPATTKTPPFYLSPPVAPAQFIQSERETTIKEMFRQAAQDVMSEVLGDSGLRTGDAQKQAFGRTIPSIAKTADMLQNGEVRLFTLWSKGIGKDWGSGSKISYKDDYAITNLMDLILQLTSIFTQIKPLSPTFVREEWKRIVREFDGKIPQDKMDKIMSELTNIADKDIIEMLKNPPKANKAQAGLPSTANMTQGQDQQTLGTDKRRSMATGDGAAQKESVGDQNTRANTSGSNT